MAILFIAALLLLGIPLLIVGAYYAGRSFSEGNPFRYRVTPFNIACGLAFLGIIVLYIQSPDAPDGNNRLQMLTPFMLGGVLLCMVLDLVLQLLLRNPRTLYITQAVVLALPLLAYGIRWFLGTGY